MTQAPGPALEQALAYYRAPAQLAGAASRPLPGEMLNVLRIAAGDEAMLERAATATGELPDTVREAAIFYVQQVLFAPGSDHYRLLGVSADAPEAQIKEHYRWLVRWLHPDRDQDDWDSVYADRITTAWQSLRTPARRHDYNTEVWEGLQSRSPPTPLLAPKTTQRLPTIVLSTLATTAALVLGLMWFGSARLAPPPAAQAKPTEQPLEPASLAARLTQPAPPAPAPAASEPAAQITAATELNAIEQAITEAPEPAPVPQITPPPQTAQTAAPPKPIDEAPAAPIAAAVAAPVAAPIAAPIAAAVTAPIAAAVTAPIAAAVTAPTAAAVTAPTAAPIAALITAPTTPALQERDAHALLREFSHLYAAGDITTLMHLFTHDARNNRGGREAIAFDYQSLFSTTSRREITLTPTGWIQADPDRATVLARYETQVTATDRRRTESSRGLIRFDLRQEGGQLRISQVQHDL